MNVVFSKKNGLMITSLLLVKGRPVCRVCGESLAVMKKTNLERHYSTKHARLSEFQGQLPKDKTNAPKQSLPNKQLSPDQI